jgi:hypothetical protein
MPFSTDICPGVVLITGHLRIDMDTLRRSVLDEGGIRSVSDHDILRCVYKLMCKHLEAMPDWTMFCELIHWTGSMPEGRVY